MPHQQCLAYHVATLGCFYSSALVYPRSYHRTCTALCSTHVAFSNSCSTSTFATARVNTDFSRPWPLVPSCYLHTLRPCTSPVQDVFSVFFLVFKAKQPDPAASPASRAKPPASSASPVLDAKVVHPPYVTLGDRSDIGDFHFGGFPGCSAPTLSPDLLGGRLGAEILPALDNSSFRPSWMTPPAASI